MAKSTDYSPLRSIAISFSGGGFRAASFNLGVLSYLSTLQSNGKSLLERTKVLSTVSGGTFTGVKYATGTKSGKSMEDIYKELFLFLRDVNIVDEAIEKLLDRSVWQNKKTRSLINAFSIVYHEKFFKDNNPEDKLFGMLWRDNKIHLEEISFNSSDFNNGLYFRFQKTERIIKPQENEPHYGIIGNKFIRIPVEAAQKIRFSDIIAASSCFPAGFEPINFPDDFIFEGLSPEEMSKIKKDIEDNGINEGRAQQVPFGLMDGGIVDNQGIDAVTKAEARMNKNANNGLYNEKDNLIDLFIISDVASPYMDDFIYTKQSVLNWWRRLNFFNIGGIFMLLILLGLAGIIFFLR
jgi:predicted acylesterase/phospholipase RssA